MATKRKLCEEFNSLTQLEEVDNAKVHGLLVNVSPMRRGRKNTTREYFEAQLVEGEEAIRVVGFQRSQMEELKEWEDKRVSQESCQVKHGKISEKLEIYMNSTSSVGGSPKKFKVSEKLLKKEIEVSDIKSKNKLDQVSFAEKVVKIEGKLSVGQGLTKQDVHIADATGGVKCVLWEGDVGKLEVGKSYTKLVVNAYQGEKYVNFPREGGEIQEIEDIGDFKEGTFTQDEVVERVEVAGVLSLECYLGCFSNYLRRVKLGSV